MKRGKKRKETQNQYQRLSHSLRVALVDTGNSFSQQCNAENSMWQTNWRWHAHDSQFLLLHLFVMSTSLSLGRHSCLTSLTHRSQVMVSRILPFGDISLRHPKMTERSPGICCFLKAEAMRILLKRNLTSTLNMSFSVRLRHPFLFEPIISPCVQTVD